jgi:hypothetical protein
MKLFFPNHLYHTKNRGHLFPLLKPFLKPDNFTDSDRIELYGLSEKDYCFTDEIQKADKAILPMSWNYYIMTKTSNEAIEFIIEAERLKKEVWMFMADDFGMTFPKYDHCKIFRSNGYRSKLSPNHLGIPAFVNDPLKEIYETSVLHERQYTKLPTVGFCGLANNTISYIIKEWLKIVYRNLKYDLRLSPIEKEQLVSPSYLRFRCLKKIRSSSLITANFIIRKQYRGGALTKKDRQKTTNEFFDNIKDSDYVLCVRGAGNFSVRLYETLAMGRIPVFVNTDCVLPLDQIVDWKKHMVWVEYNERDSIDKKIIQFHSRLDSAKKNTLFKSNRLLWEDKLRLHSFFNLISGL